MNGQTTLTNPERERLPYTQDDSIFTLNGWKHQGNSLS